MTATLKPAVLTVRSTVERAPVSMGEARRLAAFAAQRSAKR